MAECPVVPFFGAFLHELREILATRTPEGFPTGKPPKGARPEQTQQRQVVSEKLLYRVEQEIPNCDFNACDDQNN